MSPRPSRGTTRSRFFLPLALTALPVLSAHCRAPIDWDQATGGGTAPAPGAGGLGGGSGGTGTGNAHAGAGAQAGNPTFAEGGAGSALGVAGGAAGDETQGLTAGDGGGGGDDGGDGGQGGTAPAPHDCSTAETLACERGTACVDRGGEPVCEFPTQNAWLVFNSYTDITTLQAVRAVQGDTPPPELLNAFPLGHYVTELEWSPSGRYLVFNDVWSDNPYETFRTHSRLWWAEFGRGLPTRAEPIPNLPNSGHYGFPTWDPATDAMLVANGREAYVVRFQGDRPKAELAVTSDETFDLRLCRGATALVYKTDRDYLVPVGATPETPRVDLGALTDLSPDRSKVLGFLPGTSSTSQSLFTVDCQAGATPVELREIEGMFWQVSWSADSKSLLLVEKLAERTLLELVELEQPDKPVFSGEFESGSWSWDESLLLLESASPEARWHVLELSLGEPRALAIDAAVVPAWCGQYLLMETRNSETFTRQTHVLDPRNSSEPQLLIPETTDDIRELLCDSASERVAYVRYTATEQRVEIATLARPEDPPLTYALGPPIDIQLEAFYADERGLIGTLVGPEARIWWLPMPMGVAAPARELPWSDHPRFQP